VFTGFERSGKVRILLLDFHFSMAIMSRSCVISGASSYFTQFFFPRCRRTVFALPSASRSRLRAARPVKVEIGIELFYIEGEDLFCMLTVPAQMILGAPPKLSSAAHNSDRRSR